MCQILTEVRLQCKSENSLWELGGHNIGCKHSFFFLKPLNCLIKVSILLMSLVTPSFLWFIHRRSVVTVTHSCPFSLLMGETTKQSQGKVLTTQDSHLGAKSEAYIVWLVLYDRYIVYANSMLKNWVVKDFVLCVFIRLKSPNHLAHWMQQQNI